MNSGKAVNPRAVQPNAAQTPPSHSKPIIYQYMCGGSAGVALNDDTFIVASDEMTYDGVNILGIFPSEGGPPKAKISLAPALFPEIKKPGQKEEEADIEGAARIGKRIYWITSHGHGGKHGNRKEARYRFFASDIDPDGVTVQLAGSSKPFPAYQNLLEDMAAVKEDAVLQRIAELDDQSGIKPDEGGVSIEGLCQHKDEKGHTELLIAFRSPLIEVNENNKVIRKALLVPLKNPDEVIAGQGKVKAIFGAPIQLTGLGNLGIRDIAYCEQRETYIIIAGPMGKGSPSKLYQWKGGRNDQPTLFKDGFPLPDCESPLNPEAIVIYPHNSSQFQILSDDGDFLPSFENRKREIPKKDQNMNQPDMKRRFRGVWVDFPKQQ